jgi:hypothetical protein
LNQAESRSSRIAVLGGIGNLVFRHSQFPSKGVCAQDSELAKPIILEHLQGGDTLPHATVKSVI